MSPIRLFAYLVSRAASHGAAHVLVPLGIAVVAVIAALAGVLYHDLPESAVAASRPGDTPASDTVVVWGPLRFVGAEPGRVGVEVIALTVVPTRRYTLRVRNGAPDGAARVTGGEVVFNNWQVVSPDEFGTGRYEWSRVVQPRGADTLFLNVAGPGGSYVTVELLESADASFVVFGVERFTAATSGTVTRTFNISPTAAAPYRLCLANGDPDGTNRVADVEIRLNGVEVVSRAQGFSAGVASLVRDVPLVQGANTIEVTLPARQPAGFLDLCVTATDVTPPLFSIDAPVPGAVTRDTVVTVRGTVDDRTPTALTVNEVIAQRMGDAYSATVPLATEGNNVLTISAVDGAGLRTDSTRAVVRDREAPILTVTAPADGQVTTQNTAGLAGTVSDVTAVTVSANGVPVSVDSAGRFVASVPLVLGANLVTVTASDPAGNQAVVVRSIRRDPGVPEVAMSGAAAGFSCLDQGGPLVTLSGVQTQRYHNVTLADSTKIDARTARWIDVAETQTMFATRIGGGVNLCWSGGELIDSFPPATSWFTMLNRYGHRVKPSSATDLEDMRIFNYGYGVLEDSGASNWTVRRTLVRYSRATCVNNEGHNSGTIEDSFLDGCFRAVGSDGPATLGDSSAGVVVIRNSLIRLQVVDSSYFSEVPNHSAFWDWDVRAPRISLFDNVFRADARSREGQGNGKYMAPPPGKLAECSGNIMVWLGQGPFPETLPACFTVTTDVAVWDSAVAAWNAAHPPALPDLSPPIVSMFQPGVVGDTILTSTVTLIATAVDDRAVAGVQFQLDGQDIGQEQTGPTPYIGPDASLNRDLTTKYRILWNSASVGNGTHALRAVARDSTGNSTTSKAVTVTVTNGGGPPVATPLFSGEATLMQENTTFLYTGANPVQTGVAEGTIQLLRAAVIRGRVLTRALEPLPGVAVTIKDHPELGQTLTRSDGRYDLAVNGGGVLVLDFEKAGYLPAQRGVEVRWQDYTPVDDVILLQPDPALTVVDLASPDIQVARATVQSDSDGPRQATVFFEPGTQATLRRPDSTTEALTTLSVRATEFTVGDKGVEAMPAELPPASQYTYAVQVTADEQFAAGPGAVITFSQPVPLYVENFLDFPVGTAVPTGAYDPDSAAWQPRPNGVVLRITGTDAEGRALLDINGDGVPDSDSVLVFNGIDPLERVRLAGTYPVNSQLWRVPIIETLPYDLNWPFVILGGDAPRSDVTGPCGSEGADVLRCSLQVQTAFQSVGIVGSPFTLNYASDRTKGNIADRTLEIELIGDTVPSSLARVDLQIDVVGRRFEASFQPAPNLSHTFVWDGMDAFGRPVQATQPATVRVGYVYPVVYAVPTAVPQSFGLPCTIASGSCELPAVVEEAVRATRRVWETIPTTLGGFDAAGAGLGGFTSDVQHAYDPIGGQFFAGDGTRRVAATLPEQVTRFAGGAAGPCHFPTGDGGPATSALVVDPAGIAVAPDGSVYIVDRPCARVRKVDTSGIITTVAGPTGLLQPWGLALGPDGALNVSDLSAHRVFRVTLTGTITPFAGTGTAGFNQNDTIATAAHLNQPHGIAFGPDGTLYIADFGNHRVRRVGVDGIIRAFAGSGAQCFGSAGTHEQVCKSGVPATQALTRFPKGLAIGPDGTVYFTQGGGGTIRARIRRVDPAGFIYTFAGSDGTELGDGGPALQATFEAPWALGVGPDGSVYVSDEGTNYYRVRRIRPDGLITTVVGDGVPASTGTGGTHIDNIPARRARILRVEGLAFGQDGALYFADDSKVRKVSPVLPGLAGGQIVIASGDGSELYVFSPAGRILVTLDAVTRNTIYEFAYNTARQLTSITDQNGIVTLIERDAEGALIAVKAPGGQETGFERSDSTIIMRGPDGHSTTLVFDDNGMLQSVSGPGGQPMSLSYDDQGRLTQVNGANGGQQTLETASTADGSRVVITSPTNVTAVFEQALFANGVRELRGLDTTGLVLRIEENPDGSVTEFRRDGVVTTTTPLPDPRYGMEAPLGTVTVQYPSGNTSNGRTATSVTLNALNEVTATTDSVIVNGAVTVAQFDLLQRRATITSPSGRRRFATTDEAGRILRDSTPGLTPLGYAYDSAGRVDVVTQGGRTWQYDYDAAGRLSDRTDPAGRTWQFGHDAGDRPVLEVSPGGDTTRIAYDSAENITGLTLPRGQVHSFTYSAVNLLATYEPPDVGDGAPPMRMTYAQDGRLTHIVRQAGDTIAFAYDSAGRIVSRRTREGLATLRYASTGQRIEHVSAFGDTLRNTWDGERRTGETWAGAVSGGVSFTYNADGRVVAESATGSANLVSTYALDGRLNSVGQLTYTHDPQHGLTRSTTLGNVSTTSDYDGFGAATAFHVSFSATPVFDQLYTRDNLGRVTRIIETVSAQVDTVTFAYDSVGRVALVSRNGIPQAAYEYDRNGNRVRVTAPTGSTVSSYDAQDRIVNSGAATYGYSPDGERRYRATGSDTTWFTYSVADELLAVDQPNGTHIQYVVDAEGRRVGKRVNGTLLRAWLYRDQLAPTVELDGQGLLKSRFVYGERPNIPEYMVRDGRTYRLVADRLGSVRLVIDIQSGEIAQRIDYDAFGQVVFDNNPGFQPFGFAGGLFDELTGLVRFGSRDYDAATGSWTTRDASLFQGGSVNLYAYTHGDPVNSLDPTGFLTVAELEVTDAQKNKLSADEIRRFQQRLDRIKKFICSVTEKAARYSKRVMDILDAMHDHHLLPKEIFGDGPTVPLNGLYHLTDLHPIITVALKVNGLWGLNSINWNTASEEQKKLAAQAILKATEAFDRACQLRDPAYKPIAPILRKILFPD